MSGALAFHAGLAAEHCVADLYRDRGCHLLAERWRCAYGEIDLIFQNPQTGGLIFAEVKKSRSSAAAAARVTRARSDVFTMRRCCLWQISRWAN